MSNLSDIPETENPGALAGVTGAEDISDIEHLNSIVKRADTASAFCDAVADLPADLRLPLLESAVEFFRAGAPMPPFMYIMAEARQWAGWACRAELKAYALACFTHLSAKDQDAFLSYVQGERAA